MSAASFLPEKGAPAPPAQAKPRLAYLDWARGVASIIMIQGHVFNSFTHPDLRNTSTYQLSQFVGGMPPAIFLFLTGVTFAFLLYSLDKKNAPTGTRLLAAFKRSGYFFLIAYLFRLQLFITGQPGAKLEDFLKVDILNAMGLAAVPLAFLAIVPAIDRIRLAVAMGVLIAASSPVFSEMSFTGVPHFIKLYLKPDYAEFSFFPWASFMAFGVAFGTIMRMIPPAKIERLVEWGALFGFGLIISGRFFGDIDYSLYTKSEYWLDSPALVAVKLGIVLLLLAISFVWTEFGLHGRRSYVALFGMHSLLVYWVHVELVYGQLLARWKETLPLSTASVAAVVTVALMGALAVVKVRWYDQRPAVGAQAPSPS